MKIPNPIPFDSTENFYQKYKKQKSQASQKNETKNYEIPSKTTKRNSDKIANADPIGIFKVGENEK